MTQYSKINVHVTKWADRGFAAFLRNAEEDGEIELTPIKDTPAKACRDAAQRLRKLADRFDALATADDPWSTAAANRVNAGKAP
jgi:hypothetical protein